MDGGFDHATDAALDAAGKVIFPDSCSRRLRISNFVRAQALASADVLLIAAGAGFSADSGLPVYDSIAADACYASMGITYSDLCNPLMMVEQPELFYGFWGMCCNMYKCAPLHEGYALLNRWAEEAQQRLPANAALQPCWVYTSNVDGDTNLPVHSPIPLDRHVMRHTLHVMCRSVPSM
jgi:hypothetical protein